MLTSSNVIIRREFRDGDAEAIEHLHRSLYGPEYGMNEAFVAGVADSVHEAVARGWPAESGAVWLVERDGACFGSLALTIERPGVGRVRWVALDTSLRGIGLGRSMVEEMIDFARVTGLEELELETFSDLTTAAHLYRSVGFRVVSERVREDWGRPVTYQRYELKLR